jgi:hypothetical protein
MRADIIAEKRMREVGYINAANENGISSKHSASERRAADEAPDFQGPRLGIRGRSGPMARMKTMSAVSMRDPVANGRGNQPTGPAGRIVANDREWRQHQLRSGERVFGRHIPAILLTFALAPVVPSKNSIDSRRSCRRPAIKAFDSQFQSPDSANCYHCGPLWRTAAGRLVQSGASAP